MKPISKRVKYGTGGGAAGYTVGKAFSTLFLYYFVDPETPTHVAFAFEFLIELVCTGVGTFALGWMQKGD